MAHDIDTFSVQGMLEESMKKSGAANSPQLSAMIRRMFTEIEFLYPIQEIRDLSVDKASKNAMLAQLPIGEMDFSKSLPKLLECYGKIIDSGGKFTPEKKKKIELMLALQIDGLKKNNPGTRPQVELAKLQDVLGKIGLDATRILELVNRPDTLQQEFRDTFPIFCQTMTELSSGTMAGRGAGSSGRY